MRPISLLSLRPLVCALIAAGVAGVALTLAGVSTPVQMTLLLLFLAVAPATAVAGLLRGLDMFAKILMAGVATIVINAFVAEMTLSAGAWSARTHLIAIVLITAAATVVQLPPIRAAMAASRPTARAVEPAVEPPAIMQAADAAEPGPAVGALTLSESPAEETVVAEVDHGQAAG
jgi:hypothetical protein